MPRAWPQPPPGRPYTLSADPGPPIWPPLGLDRLSRAPLGRLLGRPTRFREPLGPFKKALEAKNGNVKIRPVFPSKFEPWRTFADPGPPQKAPLGPDPLYQGPPWTPPRRQKHVLGPVLDPSGINIKKKHNFDVHFRCIVKCLFL